MKRENLPAPYMAIVALVLVVGNVLLGEVRRALIIAVFAVVVITIGTVIGNAVARRSD